MAKLTASPFPLFTVEKLPLNVIARNSSNGLVKGNPYTIHAVTETGMVLADERLHKMTSFSLVIVSANADK